MSVNNFGYFLAENSLEFCGVVFFMIRLITKALGYYLLKLRPSYLILILKSKYVCTLRT